MSTSHRSDSRGKLECVCRSDTRSAQCSRSGMEAVGDPFHPTPSSPVKLFGPELWSAAFHPLAGAYGCPWTCTSTTSPTRPFADAASVLHVDLLEQAHTLVNTSDACVGLFIHVGVGPPPQSVNRRVSLGGAKTGVSAELKHIPLGARRDYLGCAERRSSAQGTHVPPGWTCADAERDGRRVAFNRTSAEFSLAISFGAKTSQLPRGGYWRDQPSCRTRAQSQHQLTPSAIAVGWQPMCR
jgi:hypothetical protein